MNQVLLWFLVGFGGSAGALTRYGTCQLFAYFGATGFPYAILLVNCVGSLLIGLLTAAIQKQLIASQPWTSLVIIGFLGALSTYSTYAMNTAMLINQKKIVKVLLNVGLNLSIGIFLAWGGYELIKHYG